MKSGEWERLSTGTVPQLTLSLAALDDLGHGVHMVSQPPQHHRGPSPQQAAQGHPGQGGTPRSKRGSSQGAIVTSGGTLMRDGSGGLNVGGPMVGPAPTTKPPTPPQSVRGNMGSLSKGSREYRTPPAVAPPQVR